MGYESSERSHEQVVLTSPSSDLVSLCEGSFEVLYLLTPEPLDDVIRKA